MAEIRKQCVVEVEDEIGRLADLTERIKQAGINILAICAWGHQGVGHLMLVSDDHDKVWSAITPFVDQCEFGDVVCAKIANKPGALNAISKKLADAGIGINVIYAAAGDAAEAMVIIDTDDNAKAAKLI